MPTSCTVPNSGPTTNADGKNRRRRALAAVARAVAASEGSEGAAAEVLQEEAARAAREADTRQEKLKAARMSAAQSRRGKGHELDADNTRPEDRCGRKTRRARKTRNRKHQAALSREAQEASTLLRRSVKDEERAQEQCGRACEAAIKKSGIRHHFRKIPKLAWFVAYFMGLSLDKSVALRALHMLQVPKARLSGVMYAAFRPTGYTPWRDVCKGKRADQQRFVHDGRPLDGKQWEDGFRDEDHPGALRVLQVFAFLWLSKTRTEHRGYTYNVRGFGRGVFAAFCRSGIKAITGHSRGVPGALLALKQAGVIWYRQPTEDPTDPKRTPLAAIDKGPSGYAYNCIWFPNDPDEQELEDLNERIRDLAAVPLLERLLANPEEVEAMAPRRKPPPQPPPFTDDEIPF